MYTREKSTGTYIRVSSKFYILFSKVKFAVKKQGNGEIVDLTSYK